MSCALRILVVFPVVTACLITDSRHMKLVHGAVAGTFPPVIVARTVARTTASTAVVAGSSADVEGLMDAFQGCGDPDQDELLQSKATLSEVLCTAPLPPALSPVYVISDVEVDDEDTDEAAAYAAMDVPDDNPPDVAPPKVRRVRRSSSRDGRTSPTFKNAPVFAMPTQVTVARKNLVPDFLLRTAAADWPDRPAAVSHTDLVRILESLPDTSSRDVAAAVASRFKLTARQSLAVRRRAAAMVVMEQHVVARVRRLPPVASSSPDDAVQAVRHVDKLLRSLKERPVLPFE